MRIRFLIANAYQMGGTARTTYNLAGALTRWYDVEVVSVFRTRTVPAFPVPEGVGLTSLAERPRRVAPTRPGSARLSTRQSAEAWLHARPSRLIHPRDWRFHQFSLHTDVRLIRFLRSTRDGVLIGTRPGLNLAMARFARPSVVRIGQEHFHLASHHDELLEVIENLYPRLDLCTTLTAEDRDSYRELLGDMVDVRCLPNGLARLPGCQPDHQSKVVIAAGRYSNQKGYAGLIQAWHRVAKTHPDWELRIFGQGSQRSLLQRSIDAHRLRGKVKLMGYTSQLEVEMSKAAFLVMSSRYEGFPMVLLEGMAAGLPAVSYDCLTGPRDLIDHAGNGYLVPNGNVRALAESITKMIELGEGRRDLSRAALKTARRYGVPVLASRWHAIIEDIAAGKPTTAPASSLSTFRARYGAPSQREPSLRATP